MTDVRRQRAEFRGLRAERSGKWECGSGKVRRLEVRIGNSACDELCRIEVGIKEGRGVCVLI
jgi:hypothetical protein